MSGDVQPRKRKDKKKKKDELGVEEPRGTSAALGEGDVFMHSPSDHGTGGHWCAKIIFFSLLAVLITLVGLIILENRGLTELEANSVESRYSNVLEGWIEDAPDDDHHDEHTLELKHQDEDDEDHGSEAEHDDDEDHNDDDDDDDDDNDTDDDQDDDNDEEEQDDDNSEEAAEDDAASEEQNLETDDDEDDLEVEEPNYRRNYENNEASNDNNDDDDGENDDDDSAKDVGSNEQPDEDDQEDDNEPQDADNEDDDDDDQKVDNDYDIDDDEKQQDDNDDNDDDDDQKDDNDDGSLENDGDQDYLQNDAVPDNEDDEEHEEEDDNTANIEIEAIEKEVTDDNASVEDPAEDEADDNNQDISDEEEPEKEDISAEDDDVEFLEPDEFDELPIVEVIAAPKGKPLAEVGESTTERPQDTLADEEEYERQQEALRKEREQASQGVWLKLTVGAALLVATHAVLRRATASRAAPKVPESRPMEKEVAKQMPVIQSSIPKEEIEDEEELEEEDIVTKPLSVVDQKDAVDKELYSDEEEAEEEEIEEIIEEKKEIPAQTIPDVTKEVTPEPDEDDDVEIIDEEQLEEELEEEEISDVDDVELLTRLEAKYGRLPQSEPERPARNKDGGNSAQDDVWPGEPSDAYWGDQLDDAERDLRQGEWTAAAKKAGATPLQSSGRARYVLARALDAAAEAKRDNQLLNRAVTAYLDLLKMNERLSDEKLLEVTNRTLDRIKFRGTYMNAEPIYKMLIRRFPDEPSYRNNLTVSFLMANRADLAEDVLKETLKLWPNDRFALAHHGFVLKTLHNRLEDAVEAFTKALKGDSGPANEPRFYYHLGDALLHLGRFTEAHEVHKRATAMGHFLSPSQRSLYNVNRLKSKPWWDVHKTPYSRLARALEKSWKEILKEGKEAKALYEKEKEGLMERGEWSQLDLFVRGREVPERCSRAPVTCGIVKSEVAASGCRRGQIKFSSMDAGTHVRPHVGPTNCRLRMHLGLTNTKDTFIRVDQETRQWQTGKVLMFDDSFEHEVWHNGTGTRLVLIVDVWHPDLTPAERRQLPAI